MDIHNYKKNFDRIIQRIKEKQKQEEYTKKQEQLKLLGVNNENELKFLLNIIKRRNDGKEWLSLYKDWKENHPDWVEKQVSGKQTEAFIKLLNTIKELFPEGIS